jgi:hypothetical protein
MKKTLFLLITTFVLSCHQNTKTSQTINSETESKTKSEMMENLDWLTGSWKRLNEEAGKETFENWNKLSPSEYSGISFTMQKADTIWQEKMNLIKSNGKWSLFIKTPDEKKPTEFKMTELDNNQFVCINDSIDFPKRILYRTEGEKIRATVSNEKIDISFEFEKNK